MVGSLSRAMAGGILTAAVIVVTAQADDTKTEEGYVKLFNGKDLSGWVYKGSQESLEGKTETSDSRFTVVDGAIVANEGKGIKDLYTKGEFNKNFQLKLQFRAGNKADSGVYLRGQQLQIRDFARRGEQKHLTQFKNDDWNDLEVIVTNDVLRAAVNGKALTDQDNFELSVKGGKATAKLNGSDIDPANVLVTRGAVATYKVNGDALQPLTMSIGARGGIGVQAESGKFEFRRIRVKELP